MDYKYNYTLFIVYASLISLTNNIVIVYNYMREENMYLCVCVCVCVVRMCNDIHDDTKETTNQNAYSIGHLPQ